MKKQTAFAAAIVAALMLVSCATSVPVSVTRPAELDLNGAKTIAILPFQISTSQYHEESGNTVIDVINAISYLFNKDDPDEISSAECLTNALTQRLSNSSYLTLVDSSTVKRTLQLGRKAPVDVYLTGKITQFESRIDTQKVNEKVNDVYTTVLHYKRTVNVTVVYQIVDASTSTVIAYRSRNLSESSADDKMKSNLPGAYDVISSRLVGLCDQIMKEIQPYSETKYLSLLKDKTKNPELKTANELAKQGLVVQAEQRYYAVYQSTGDFASGYNAAKLMQAEGKLEGARALMEELVNRTGDKRAITALSDIMYEINQSARLEHQLQEQGK